MWRHQAPFLGVFLASSLGSFRRRKNVFDRLAGFLSRFVDWLKYEVLSCFYDKKYDELDSDVLEVGRLWCVWQEQKKLYDDPEVQDKEIPQNEFSRIFDTLPARVRRRVEEAIGDILQKKGGDKSAKRPDDDTIKQFIEKPFKTITIKEDSKKMEVFPLFQALLHVEETLQKMRDRL